MSDQHPFDDARDNERDESDGHPHSISLLSIDVLPGHSAVAFDLYPDPQRPRQIRFRAMKLHRWRKDEVSKWSGWFDIEDCPIALCWDAFDFGNGGRRL